MSYLARYAHSNIHILTIQITACSPKVDVNAVLSGDFGSSSVSSCLNRAKFRVNYQSQSKIIFVTS